LEELLDPQRAQCHIEGLGGGRERIISLEEKKKGAVGVDLGGRPPRQTLIQIGLGQAVGAGDDAIRLEGSTTAIGIVIVLFFRMSGAWILGGVVGCNIGPKKNGQPALANPGRDQRDQDHQQGQTATHHEILEFFFEVTPLAAYSQEVRR
jgi:hypothetical protein